MGLTKFITCGDCGFILCKCTPTSQPKKEEVIMYGGHPMVILDELEFADHDLAVETLGFGTDDNEVWPK